MIEQKKVAGQNRNEAGETPAIPERGHPVRIDAVSAAEQVRSVTNGKELSELELNADDIAIDFYHGGHRVHGDGDRCRLQFSVNSVISVVKNT